VAAFLFVVGIVVTALVTDFTASVKTAVTEPTFSP
jgi:hypothetical protein